MRARRARSAPCGTALATFGATGLRAARVGRDVAKTASALAKACANLAKSLQTRSSTLPFLFLLMTTNKVY